MLTLGGLTVIALLPIDHRYGLAFGLPFAVGALIPMLPHRPRWFDVPLVVISVVVLMYDRLVLGGWSLPERVFDLIETAAAFVIVRDIFTQGHRYRFLLASPVVTLGEISFSIYLLHLPVFLILFAGIAHFIGLGPLIDHPVITQVVMSVVTATATIVMSMFTYRLVELPMHNLGRGLAKGISRGKCQAIPVRRQKAEPPLA
jgi:peptidoglycan/LPS O-acetylase OafA/YrhL